jgi:adenylate cyclase
MIDIKAFLQKLLMGKSLPIILSLLITFMVLFLFFTKNPSINALITRFDYISYDLRLQLMPKATRNPDVPIIIIDIDENSIAKEGRWPWSRKKMAMLLEKLQKNGSLVVAFDILFSESERNIADEVLKSLPSAEFSATTEPLDKIIQQFDYDNQFAIHLQQGDNILGMTFDNIQRANIGKLPAPLLTLNQNIASKLHLRSSESFTAPTPLLQEAAQQVGFLNTSPDDDGIVRRSPIVLRYQDNIYPSLALEAIARYLLIDDITLDITHIGKQQAIEHVNVGHYAIPTDEVGRVLIPYIGASPAFTSFPATDIIHSENTIPELTNALVFIGTSALGLGDMKTTPLQNSFPGVEVHANIANGILNQHFPYTPAWTRGAELIMLIGLGFMLSFILPFLRHVWLLTGSIALLMLLTSINFWLWKAYGLALPLTLPLLLVLSIATLNMTYGFLSERSQRGQLKNMFGQYVPAAHIDHMVKNGGSYGFEGENRNMTVLFSDIRGFTTISESMTVTELKHMLNTFFTDITDIIFQFDGTIDKYVGDMVMAFWGAPLHDEHHALHALQAAQAMQKKVLELAPQFAEKNYPEVRIGIGLNTGAMNVGDMGSKFRRNYTVLGDAVNLGSRLESVTKFYHVNTIISESTFIEQKEYICRPLDCIRVKGKYEPVKIFEPIGTKEAVSQDLQDELTQHQQALDYYLQQQWQSAKSAFAQLNKKNAQCFVYQLYLDRIIELEKNPPGENWDGVYTFLMK